MTEPWYSLSAPKISSRDAGSKLLVGSSSNSTFAALTTNIAKANLVFSPPLKTLTGFFTSSPENKNEPKTFRASGSRISTAELNIFSSTVLS